MQANAITETHFSLPGQTHFYRGKVRDVYHIEDRLIMVASDRISAFDHILPRAIPHKGQVLNQIAAHFLDQTADIIPNWLIATPDPNVSIGWSCEPIKIEMVIRGYLAGHAWRLYKAGFREICGVTMPEGLREGDRFPTPIITPATKAESGHDEDISPAEIIQQGILTESEYDQLADVTRALFIRGSEMAARQGLILVDTKYEFGKKDGQFMLIDEVHTPDSSRYYYAKGYEERQTIGEKQRQLSKEFVREWLMAHGFQGLEGQLMPEMPDHFVEMISRRYIELFERITGETFVPADTSNIQNRIASNILNWLAINS